MCQLFLNSRQKGLCQPRPPPDEDIYGQRDDDMGEKDYVRTPWQTNAASQGSLHSSKGISWTRETDYPAFGTELPPCTPLMDRFHKPPLYGQIGSKLPCGCPTYVTRNEVIQEAQESPSRVARREHVSVNPSNPDHVQYFIVEPDMVPSGERGQSHPVVTSQNAVPRGAVPTPHSNHNSTSTFKPPNNGNQQTDEIKLRMRMTDTGPSGGKAGSKGVTVGSKPSPTHAKNKTKQSGGASTIHESYKAMCKDRLDNASNEHIECVVSSRDTTKDTEL